MQENKKQILDNYGRYTLYGVFEECKSEIDKGLKAFPKGVTKSKQISYRVFAKVVSLYFKILFQMLIEGASVPLLNKFGILNVVKTKCTRYNPSRISFFKDEQGKVVRKIKKLNTNFGYWYFVFWDAPKKLRHYQFNINIKYKHKYMEMVESGFDYLDYTLDKYGRNASHTYIQHIK